MKPALDRKKFIRKEGATGADLDEERQNIKVYEYLCRIGEAKQYVCLKFSILVLSLNHDQGGLRPALKLKLKILRTWRKVFETALLSQNWPSF